MADGTISILEPDSVSKRLDAEVALQGAQLVYRERVQPRLASEPRCELRSATDLAPGSQATLDASAAATGSPARLLRLDCASTVACRWDIQVRDGGAATTYAVLMTSGLAGGRPGLVWRAEDVGMVTYVGDGASRQFRVVVTNLDPQRAADVFVSFQWDEGVV